MSSLNESCVVLVPVGSHIEPQVEVALRELERRGYPVWRSYGCSAIDFARSRLATQALAHGFKETLWIDSDVLFEPNEVDRLRGVTNGELAAAGVPVTDNPQDRPGVLTGVYVKKGLRELALHMVAANETMLFGVGAAFARVKCAPCGMLLVRDWVYRRVQDQCGLPHCKTNEPWGLTPYFLPMIIHEPHGPSYLCEDFAFSHRVQQCGVPIWADMRMRLFHLGTYPYGWEDAGHGVERFQSYRFTLCEKE